MTRRQARSATLLPPSVRARATAAFSLLFTASGISLFLLFLLADDLPAAASHTTCLAFVATLACVGGIASWIITGCLLAPIRRVTAAARRAADGALNHRLDRHGPDDEFTELSEAFDLMLGRLEQSFAARERFAANASHELRTPLTTSKVILKLAKDRPQSVDVHHLVERLSDANDRSIRTVEALLELAESTHTGIELSPVDLRATAVRAAEHLADEAAAAQITVTSESEIGVLADGDPALIERLVTNLLQNAIRHNVAHGRAHLIVATVARGTIVSVSNTGPVVGREDAARLTEPFFRIRGRPSRAARPSDQDRGPEGLGLGLALASNIAQAHRAELTITPNRSGGLTVTARFPTSTALG